MDNEITITLECESCKGTGIYRGMGEGPGAGVVCSTCKGQGFVVRTFVKFTGRKIKDGIEWVYSANPGIKVGSDHGHEFKDFGGMPYRNWIAGNPFPEKSENRSYTCPAWWYQGAPGGKKPDWKECNANLGTRFADCKLFPCKENCWKHFDKEAK